MIRLNFNGNASASTFRFSTNIDEDEHGGDTPKTIISFEGSGEGRIEFCGTFELHEFMDFCREIIKLEKDCKFNKDCNFNNVIIKRPVCQ